MFSPTSLPLHAELLLLAHDPASGKRLIAEGHLKAGLAGAALLELNLQEALALEGDGKQARLRSSGADVAPELVPLLARADGYAPKKAVARIGGAESFKDRAGDLRDATWCRLESEGLVRSHEDKVMGIFPTTRRVQLTTSRSGRIETIRVALNSTSQPDPRTSGLVAVVAATGLLPKLVPDMDRKLMKARVKHLAEGGWGGDAVAKAISDVQAAIVAGVIVPAMATTTG
ncbi:MAG: GPP34 family phosphoprotein [Terracoccus sp.]